MSEMSDIFQDHRTYGLLTIVQCELVYKSDMSEFWAQKRRTGRVS